MRPPASADLGRTTRPSNRCAANAIAVGSLGTVTAPWPGARCADSPVLCRRPTTCRPCRSTQKAGKRPTDPLQSADRPHLSLIPLTPIICSEIMGREFLDDFLPKCKSLALLMRGYA